MVSFQFPCGSWNVIDNPVMESLRDGRIEIRDGKSETLGPLRDANPIEFGRDIAATDDRDIEFCFRKFARVKQETGNRDGPTGFRNSPRISRQQAHGGVNFLFFHGNDVVHILTNMLKIQFTNALRPETIGLSAQHLLSRKGDDSP